MAIPFVGAGEYPVRDGNAVRLLVDGAPAFRRICDAIDAAEHSVWVTVAFMWPDFQMPDARGSALDVLDRAAARDVDVRIVFWRPDVGMERHRRTAFWGSPDHVTLLERRRSGVKIRWDRARAGFCQHQKAWLIDAGADSETAFVGGINLNPHSVVVPGHGGARENHDAYLEMRGPSVVDVHHNFVERWNQATERLADHGTWGIGSDTDLAFPRHTPRRRGKTVTQIQRSNFAQYCAAIDAARRSIYIENQYLETLEIIERLDTALRRGVDVIALLPAEPEGASGLPARAALSRYENFTMAGIAGLSTRGERIPVYVHDKLMLVDDAWATVGSCNLHGYSFFGNREMNVALSDLDAVRAMRVQLFDEHLAHDTSQMDDRAALRLFRQIALENRERADRGDVAWKGLAFALDVEGYGSKPPANQ
jgi:cardiolipin synthase A/B